MTSENVDEKIEEVAQAAVKNEEAQAAAATAQAEATAEVAEAVAAQKIADAAESAIAAAEGAKALAETTAAKVIQENEDNLSWLRSHAQQMEGLSQAHSQAITTLQSETSQIKQSIGELLTGLKSLTQPKLEQKQTTETVITPQNQSGGEEDLKETGQKQQPIEKKKNRAVFI